MIPALCETAVECRLALTHLVLCRLSSAVAGGRSLPAVVGCRHQQARRGETRPTVDRRPQLSQVPSFPGLDNNTCVFSEATHAQHRQHAPPDRLTPRSESRPALLNLSNSQRCDLNDGTHVVRLVLPLREHLQAILETASPLTSGAFGPTTLGVIWLPT